MKRVDANNNTSFPGKNGDVASVAEKDDSLSNQLLRGLHVRDPVSPRPSPDISELNLAGLRISDPCNPIIPEPSYPSIRTRVNVAQFFPHNIPMQEEMLRLFGEDPHFELYMEPIQGMYFSPPNPMLAEIREDFDRNGLPDVEYCPEFEKPYQAPAKQDGAPVDNGNILYSRIFTQHRRAKDKTNFKKKFTYEICVFCRNNQETRVDYTTHSIRDSKGIITCPILRAYVCPICQASGDNAHTLRYCPNKFTYEMRHFEKNSRLNRAPRFNR